MKCAYPACIYKENTGKYTIIFPDLNDLATFGDNLSEAMEMAVDCLAGYIYTLELEGREIPAPSELKDIKVEEYEEVIEANTSIIFVDVDEYAKNHFVKPVKKTLTIPRWLNMMAMNENINFSQLLKKALIEELELKGKQLP